MDTNFLFGVSLTASFLAGVLALFAPCCITFLFPSYLGAIIMILMGVMTLKPIFHIPQFFHVSPNQDKKIGTLSVFGLGLMSGLTSACCAPVLFAAVTLTSLSPTLFQAFIISLAYVVGIVMPLFVMSMFYEQAASKIGGPNRQKIYNVLKYIGATIFFITGILIALFNFQGKIQMNQMEPYSQKIRLIVFEIVKYFQNQIVDLLIFGMV